MGIRDYRCDDFAACLEVFDSNVPKFFAAEERDEFIADLKRLNDPYFVAEQAGCIIGCGGYFVRDGRAGLWWGMVHKDLHGQGLGRALVQHRLDELARTHPTVSVFIDTSQHTRPFYERMGFTAYSVEENGYGPGLHKVLMQRDAVAQI